VIQDSVDYDDSLTRVAAVLKNAISDLMVLQTGIGKLSQNGWIPIDRSRASLAVPLAPAFSGRVWYSP
jgi:hypothetical protein